MTTNRRHWIKQIGLGIAGIGLTQLNTFAAPAVDHFANAPKDDSPTRLNLNENPYGPSPMAITAMGANLSISNRYNWNITEDLISAIAKRNNVTPEHIILGAGSTQILDLIVQFIANQKGSFVLADPTHGSWAKTAEQLGLKKISVPLDAGKQHDLAAMLKAVEPETKMVYVCNPNNPTATICDGEALIGFIKEVSKKAIVVVDEAYLEFTNQASVNHLVNENKNLVVVKTFSKIYGLAGCRIGYAIANIETMKEISLLQTWASGGISVTSRLAAIASLKDEHFVKECYSLNEKARKYTIEQLELLNIHCIPSHTNFIYFSLADYKKDYFELLKSNNILGPGIWEENGKWTRITVGKMEEMQKFINAIK